MPDQRTWRMAGNAVSFGIHIANGIAMLCMLRGDVLKDKRVNEMHSQQFVYLTIWNLFFQKIYLFANLVCDLQEMLNIKDRGIFKLLRTAKDIFFDGLVFPTTIVVAIIFWPFFIYDRELIFPKFIDHAIGAIPNYIMHGFIILVIIWDMRYQSRHKPVSTKWHLLMLSTLIVLYLCVILYNYARNGLWPYPFLRHIHGTIYFPLFVISSAIIMFGVYFAQWPLRRILKGKYEENKLE